ncbi:MAG: S-layer family protein [Synechococcales bacterium]|nr:S-layer family protein [Synechococcales bacterium]
MLTKLLCFYPRPLVGLLPGLVTLLFGNFAPLQAQVVPDSSLPNPSSVEAGCVRCTINGGTLRGNNLFHSFAEFSVPTNGEAIFNNPSTVEHIFSRVTGDTVSNIDGFIRANGTANLFLINPNGIIFGPNAQLDIGGSLVASTADAIQFGDRTFFSASEPTPSPLLSIDPSALLFTAASLGAIEVQSAAPSAADVPGMLIRGLRVPDGASLILAGGNIALNGGGLNALGGQVSLIGLAEPGAVELDGAGGSLGIDLPANLGLADVSLTNEATIRVDGARGGGIEIWGDRVTLSGDSTLSANTLGSSDGGGVAITATRSTRLSQGSLIESSTATPASGDAGDILITTPALLIRGAAQIISVASGSGLGGSLIINASESVQLTGANEATRIASGLYAVAFGRGIAGDIVITTENLLVQDAAQISVSTFGSGAGGRLNITAAESVRVAGTSASGRFASSVFATARSTGQAGTLRIATNQLLVQDGAQISAGSFSEGDGGSLVIDAAESVLVTDTRTNSLFPNGIFTQTESSGNAGELVINTQRLVVSGGSRVSSGTNGAGSGGRFVINALESVQVTGRALDGQRLSGLFTGSTDVGPAGDLEIVTPTVLVQDGAEISSDTTGGRAGSIDITAQNLETLTGGRIIVTTQGPEDAGRIVLSELDQVRLSGEGSGLFANAGEESSGDGGRIFVDSRVIRLRNGASIAVDSQGTGRGGRIRLVSDSLSLNNRSTVLAETESNAGGSIQLQLQDELLLRRGSQISTTAGNAEAGGDGGNITVNIPNGFVVAAAEENSDITANAFEGRGGNVSITALGIFGLEPRNELTELSDITASSAFGVSGVVELDIPDVDPTEGVAELPSSLVDASQLVAQGCATPGQLAQNPQGEFVDVGRGGIAPAPTGLLDSSDAVADLQAPSSWSAGEEGSASEVVEARGWIEDSDGTILLVAERPPTVTGSACWQ